MSMFYCEGCQELRDNDWFPMEEDGLCPDCHLEKESQKAEREYEISQRHAQWCKERNLL